MTVDEIRKFTENRRMPELGPDGTWEQSKVYPAPEFPFKGWQPPQPDGYIQSARTPSDSAIVLDNGSSTMKVGWSFDKKPRYQIPPLLAKFKDRKGSKYCAFVGYDCYADATNRGQIRNAFESHTSVPVNWDVLEGVLDYTFLKLGITNSGGVDRPVIMTEPVANLGYTRRTMNEMLFEGYSVPSVMYGIDSLFSYHYNRGRTGLVVSSSHASTQVIPVLDGKPLLHACARLSWGGSQSQAYLERLIKLKYPGFQIKGGHEHYESLIKQFCYTSVDYNEEMLHYLDWANLKDRDAVVQYPYNEQQVKPEKTAEESEVAEIKKKQRDARFAEMSARNRLEKLMQKEETLAWYLDMQRQLKETTVKKEQKRILDELEINDEAGLEREIRELTRKIKKARKEDLGAEEESLEDQLNKFPLLDVPDEDLDPEKLKEKRHQRLMRAGVEARLRARHEKERERARDLEEKRLDEEQRINHPSEWIAARRAQRLALINRMKELTRHRADAASRKGMASQARMKTLASLASDGPKRKRRGAGEYDDDFGADDRDWEAYRGVQAEPASDDEEPEEDPQAQMELIEHELLRYDPNFTENDTLKAQSDWKRSLMHAYLYGVQEGEPEQNSREKHQLHLNVERIRVPEVIFQPGIAGVDQAGIIEIIEGIVMNRFTMPSQRKSLVNDIFLTGGNTSFLNFNQRMRQELVAVLPSEYSLNVRGATDPILDAWRGAASWWTSASTSQRSAASVSRADYLEFGSDYMKEHNLGNSLSTTFG